MRTIVWSAYTGTDFYRTYYDSHGFHPSQLRTIEDIARIPIVTKEQLRMAPLELRSLPRTLRWPSNTGGTSGSPLHFYRDFGSYGREMFYIHEGWGRLGYKPTDLKLALRGAYRGPNPLRYSLPQHEILLNIYMPFEHVSQALNQLYSKHNIAYVHGYPTAIASLIGWLEVHAPQTLEKMRSSTRGVLLGSEYPTPANRTLISDLLGAPIISWYGHSERAVLAFEVEPYVYRPYPTYGFAEAISQNPGHVLVATSFASGPSPFIRYATGDLVEAQLDDSGLLNSFSIMQGRDGDSVTDNCGHEVSLTALIFGRHHSAYEYVDHVQVAQPARGEIVLIATVRSPLPDSAAPQTWFQLDNVDLRVHLALVDAPIRSASGKLPLKVTRETWDDFRAHYDPQLLRLQPRP